MGFYQLQRSQLLHKPSDEIWSFISNPRNLKKITPKYMGFDICNVEELSEQMHEGMIIQYKVAPLLGIKTTWVTEITHIRDKEYFVDEQRVGPYIMWHHQHFLEKHPQGTLMKDIVSYQPPLGLLGDFANSLLLQKKLESIFDYRFKILTELFGSTSLAKS